MRLKVGCPIILIKNIDQVNRLCIDTRLIVVAFGKKVIGTNVVTRKNNSDNILISRMNLVQSDIGLSSKFTGKRFPMTFFLEGQ